MGNYFKAYLRGIIISYTSTKRRKRIQEQRQLEYKMHEVEKQHKQHPTKVNWDKVLTAKMALNTLLSQKAERAIFLQKHKLYEYGNKSGRYLAALINNKSKHKPIAKIKSKTGNYCHTPNYISSVFMEFYKKSLYVRAPTLF